MRKEEEMTGHGAFSRERKIKEYSCEYVSLLWGHFRPKKLYARRRKIQTIAVCKTDVRDFANLPESSDLGDSEIEESLGLQHCLRKKSLKDGIHLRILIASNFGSPVLNEKCLRLKNVRCNNYAGRGWALIISEEKKTSSSSDDDGPWNMSR